MRKTGLQKLKINNEARKASNIIRSIQYYIAFLTIADYGTCLFRYIQILEAKQKWTKSHIRIKKCLV